jgi:hypothetical protein
MSGDARYEYQDPARVTGWLSTFLWILLLFLVASIASLVLQYQLLESVEAHRFVSHDELMAAANANDLRVLIALRGAALFGIVAAITFFVWLYRVSANVHALGASELSAGPGFAVGMYFIPVMNLIMPFLAMGEIWKASIDAPQWKMQKGTLLIPLWWFLQIATGIAAIVILFRGTPSKDIPSLKEYTVIILVVYSLDIAFRLAILLLTKRVCSLQIAQDAQRKSAAPGLAIGDAVGR